MIIFLDTLFCLFPYDNSTAKVYTYTESYMYTRVYTSKIHTLYEYYLFAVRQRDLAERELHHRRVAFYWRLFFYHVRRVVCLRRTRRWTLGRSRTRVETLSIAWVVKEIKRIRRGERRDSRDLALIATDRTFKSCFFFLLSPCFLSVNFFCVRISFFGPFEHSKTLVSLFFLSICRAPCIRFRAK